MSYGKEKQRAELKSDVDAFLAGGGKIETLAFAMPSSTIVIITEEVDDELELFSTSVMET